ncbi:MAG: hypothetical protein F4036_10755 [Gammaproteobacteria bacterium]|nr:hypothetical protein [Gammaproteobacteria bacterium]
MRKFFFIAISALALTACGSSGGTDNPPAPPAPVAPPPPPPEPTFEERLADLAAFDPNPCRALTPGFEALGGWLKNDGRELGNSRVWIGDYGTHDVAHTPETHGAGVWATFTDCAVRSSESQYHDYDADGDDTVGPYYRALAEHGEDLISSVSGAPDYEDIPLPEPGEWGPNWNSPGILGRRHDGTHEGQRALIVQAASNDSRVRTPNLQTPEFQLALRHTDIVLWIIVGGYVGDGTSRTPSASSSICGAADPLCLFAPWGHAGRAGTSHATPQVSAALDTVWTVWPDMDILDLRNLAFDCAENMAARDGDTSTERTFSYSNGREFTSTTNSTWGHGILSLTCLFTPNGGLMDPTTGDAIAGGIFGPIAGPITGATITGADYTGRTFGHGFARPVARENFALAATANLSAVQRRNGIYGVSHAAGAYQGRLLENGAFHMDLAAAGNAIGATAGWRQGGFTLRTGLAMQPEGAGSLTGSRAFRAPSTVSAAITAAYGRALRHGLSAHLQADHWRTLASAGRSLWENASLRESRLSAALIRRAGRHEFALQAVWRSGLSGSLGVDGRSWALSPQAESGVWLTWRMWR